MIRETPCSGDVGLKQRGEPFPVLGMGLHEREEARGSWLNPFLSKIGLALQRTSSLRLDLVWMLVRAIMMQLLN
jgi:hypothetical protein